MLRKLIKLFIDNRSKYGKLQKNEQAGNCKAFWQYLWNEQYSSNGFRVKTKKSSGDIQINQ